MSLFSKSHRGFKSDDGGFSVVELIVTLTIVTTLITVVVTNQSRYLDGAALSNLADEVGLTFSQAQAYGIAVKEVSPGSADFTSAYGLTFSLLGSGSPTAHLFFADRNVNGSYDGTWDCVTGGLNECLEKKDITRGNYIHQICAVRSSGGDECSGIGRVDITFVRPATQARLVFYNSSGALYVPANLLGARITFKSPGELSRSVLVYQTGQISVQ